MNRKLIVRILGAILAIEGLAMIPAFLVSLIYRDGNWMWYLLTIGICLAPASIRRNPPM